MKDNNGPPKVAEPETLKLTRYVMTYANPENTAWKPNNNGATNKKLYSNGSEIPIITQGIVLAIISDAIFFLFSGFAAL